MIGRVSATSAWQAILHGIARSAKYRQVILAAYLVSLVSGLILLVIPALSLIGPAHRPAVREAANGLDAWLVLEFEESPLTTGLLQGGQDPVLPPGFQQGLLVGLLTLGGALPLAWVTSSFLDGAILSTYSRFPAGFEWRGFLAAGWHWFLAFLLFNPIQAIAGLAVLFVSLEAGRLAGSLAWPVSGLVLIAWLAWTESTRVVAVREGSRNIFRAAGRAAGMIYHKPLRILAFYLFAAAALGLIHLGFRLGLMPHLHLEQWPLVLLIGQAFILLRLWARLARWAGLMVMAGDREPRPDETAQPDPVP